MIPWFGWSGGAAFVGALAFFAYTYAVTLGRPAVSSLGTPLAVLANALLFFVFAAHHSLFVRTFARRWVTRRVRASLERSVYVWVASLLLILACAAWQPLPGVIYRRAGFLAGVHLALVAAGLALIVLGAGRLNPLDLAGIAQARRARGDREALVTSFPYNLVRHPIYLGWILAVFGVPTLTWSRLLMACLSTLYLFIAVPWEERRLAAQFGPDYESYRYRVRWRIIPGLY